MTPLPAVALLFSLVVAGAVALPVPGSHLAEEERGTVELAADHGLLRGLAAAELRRGTAVPSASGASATHMIPLAAETAQSALVRP